MRSTLLIPLLIGWLLVGVAAGQEYAAPLFDSTLQVSQYHHTAWYRTDGLPQESAYAFAQTPDGYLWIGTQEGLVRFDGVRFTNFSRADTPAFPSNDVRTLHVDGGGTLWIGTEHGGLIRYKKHAFERVAEALPHGVSAIVSGADGLWVGTLGGGVFRLTNGTLQPTFTDTLSDAFVSALHRTADGRLWIGTHNGLYAGKEGSEAQSVASVSGQFVNDLAERDGLLWAATRSGIVGLNAKGEIVSTPGPREDVRAFVAGASDAFWLAAGQSGLARYQNGMLSAWPAETDLRVVAMMEDRDGALWIGTEHGGLHRLGAASFTPYSVPEGVASPIAGAVMESRDGALWIGTDGEGLTRIKHDDARTFTSADGLVGTRVLALAEDQRGHVWVGSLDGGLERWDGRAFTPYGTDDGLPGTAVFSAYVGPSGTLWIGTDNGVARYDTAQDRFVALVDLAFPIATLHEDAAGRLWIGTYDAGLMRWDGRTLTDFAEHPVLSGMVITDLHETDDGTIWVGTYGGGLARVRKNDVATLSTANGLPDNNVFQILEDDAGFFWMGNNNGIVRIARAQLDARLDDPDAPLPVRHFDSADGLRNPEGTGGFQPAGWKGRDGRLWFPTVDGVAGVDPARLRLPTFTPLIEAFVVDGETSGTAEQQLAPGTRRLSVQFTAPAPAHAGDLFFRYRLLGFEDEWTYTAPDADRVEHYMNLAPGKYAFEVQARAAGGTWSAPATLTFTQRPFFYQTWWFLALLPLALFGLGFVGHRLHVQRLKKRQAELEHQVDLRTRDLRLAKERTERDKATIEEQADKLKELDRFKTRFFSNVSHEFRTPLTLMIGPLENALAGSYGPLTETLRGQVGVMHRNALRLLRLINQLLDLAKLESGNMQLAVRSRDVVGFVRDIVHAFSGFADQRGITLDFQADTDRLDAYFEPDKLEKVFYNLLSNASKFTSAGGRVTVSLEHLASSGDDEGRVRVRVTDTGRGIAAADLPYVFDRFRQVDESNTREFVGTGIGLALVKELVLLHSGEIDVESTFGEGTTFTVTLPLGNAHFTPDQIATGSPSDEVTPTQLVPMTADRPSVKPARKQAPATAPLLLIVDDNADIRDYIASCLGDLYRTVEAADGAEGHMLARRYRPDLVLSDVMMPNVDGLELCRRIKSDPDLDHTPVILLTAKTSQETLIEGLHEGADEYMSKPFNAKELRARIGNLLMLRAQERALKELNERLEEKVEAQVGVIVQEKARAERASQFKTEVLNNLSHEFRTPLTAVIGLAEVLQLSDDAERAECLDEFLEDIVANGRRLVNTLSSVLDLADLESNHRGLVHQQLDMRNVVDTAAQKWEPLATEHALDFVAHTPAGPAPVSLDPKALARVLDLLLDNACKFTPEGQVGLALEVDAVHVRIHVRDTGIGIGEAFLPTLFEPFKQESVGLARRHEGCGLGLTIAHHLVQLSGGSLHVKSRQGEGSTFTITFPRADGNAQRARRAA